MKKERDITTSDLNESLRRVGCTARRINKALGYSTLYEEDGYLIEIKSSGVKRPVNKLKERNKRGFSYASPDCSYMSTN
jgi:ribosome maturation factor RimP